MRACVSPNVYPVSGGVRTVFRKSAVSVPRRVSPTATRAVARKRSHGGRGGPRGTALLRIGPIRSASRSIFSCLASAGLLTRWASHFRVAAAPCPSTITSTSPPPAC
ncbi:hypothetical protein [Azospirillum doebereinerae]